MRAVPLIYPNQRALAGWNQRLSVGATGAYWFLCEDLLGTTVDERARRFAKQSTIP